MDYVRREVEERQLVEEAIDPDGIEGFVHVEESCAGGPTSKIMTSRIFSKRSPLQAKPSKSVNWGRKHALRASRRPPVC